MAVGLADIVTRNQKISRKTSSDPIGNEVLSKKNVRIGPGKDCPTDMPEQPLPACLLAASAPRASIHAARGRAALLLSAAN